MAIELDCLLQTAWNLITFLFLYFFHRANCCCLYRWSARAEFWVRSSIHTDWPSPFFFLFLFSFLFSLYQPCPSSLPNYSHGQVSSLKGFLTSIPSSCRPSAAPEVSFWLRRRQRSFFFFRSTTSTPHSIRPPPPLPLLLSPPPFKRLVPRTLSRSFSRQIDSFFCLSPLRWLTGSSYHHQTPTYLNHPTIRLTSHRNHLIPGTFDIFWYGGCH